MFVFTWSLVQILKIEYNILQYNPDNPYRHLLA